MSQPIDDFQGLLARYFRELILATAYLELGSRLIVVSPANASIALTLSPDITTEPMYLHELLPHSSAVAHGASELFQSKAIAAWADLLNVLFEMFVSAHIEGKRQYPELKKRSTRLDFSSIDDINTQVRLGLVADFAFSKYADRIHAISRILNPESELQVQLFVIKKHVAIRNANQHHGGRIYDDMLKDFGTDRIEVLDHVGNPKLLVAGQSVELFVPELDRLKSALFCVTNPWKARLV